MNAREFVERLRNDRDCDRLAVGERLDPSVQAPSYLPADLLELYRLANGARFWTDADDQGYFWLLPLDRLGTPVRDLMFGTEASARNRGIRPDAVIALTGHLDGTQFLALDTRDGRYLDADPYIEPRAIGRSLPEALDWIWAHWVEALRDDDEGDEELASDV